jgi:hypothetical protein
VDTMTRRSARSSGPVMPAGRTRSPARRALRRSAMSACAQHERHHRRSGRAASARRRLQHRRVPRCPGGRGRRRPARPWPRCSPRSSQGAAGCWVRRATNRRRHRRSASSDLAIALALSRAAEHLQLANGELWAVRAGQRSGAAGEGVYVRHRHRIREIPAQAPSRPGTIAAARPGPSSADPNTRVFACG